MNEAVVTVLVVVGLISIARSIYLAAAYFSYHKKVYVAFEPEEWGLILHMLQLQRSICRCYGNEAKDAEKLIVAKTQEAVFDMRISSEVISLFDNEFSWYRAVKAVRSGHGWKIDEGAEWRWSWRYDPVLIVANSKFRLADGRKREDARPLIEQLSTFLSSIGTRGL